MFSPGALTELISSHCRRCRPAAVLDRLRGLGRAINWEGLIAPWARSPRLHIPRASFILIDSLMPLLAGRLIPAGGNILLLLPYLILC